MTETYDVPGMAARGKKADNVPRVIQWLGHDMLTQHSFERMLHDIVHHQTRNNLTTISVIGTMDSGKTTITRILAHKLHLAMQEAANQTSLPLQLRAKIRLPYIVVWLEADDLLDLEATLLALPPGVPRILIFDDTSFAGTRDQERAMAHAMARVRHISSDGQSVKTVCFIIYHYSKSINKFARDTKFRIITSLGAEERKSFIDLLGHAQQVKNYERRYQALTGSRGAVQYVLATTRTGRPLRVYELKQDNPWRLALYHDGATLREVVYPHDDMLVPPQCTTCNKQQADNNAPGVVAALIKAYGAPYVERALQYAAYASYGAAALPRGKTSAAAAAVQRILGTGYMRLLDMLEAYNHADHGNSRNARNFDASAWASYTTDISKELADELWKSTGIDLGRETRRMNREDVATRTLQTMEPQPKQEPQRPALPSA